MMFHVTCFLSVELLMREVCFYDALQKGHGSMGKSNVFAPAWQDKSEFLCVGDEERGTS